MEKRYGCNAGVPAIHCSIVACGIVSSSGVNHDVVVRNFANTAPTR